jgi:hypothetical protein
VDSFGFLEFDLVNDTHKIFIYTTTKKDIILFDAHEERVSEMRQKIFDMLSFNFWLRRLK